MSSEALSGAFALLVETVRDWRDRDRRTTTAGITSALLATGTFDPEALGFSSREEFWKAAESADVVQRERLPNGHWYVLLPGEALPDDLLTPRTGPPAGPSKTRPTGHVSTPPVPGGAPLRVRLRADVWNAFVDWEGAYRRYWDRTHLRAFLVPAEWAPTETDIERFVEITPASFAMQVEWMHDFAGEQTEDDAASLEASLADGAPRGAFRRELDVRGLSRQWRERHRHHITDQVTAWAISHDVDLGFLTDNRSLGTHNTGTHGRAVSRRSATAPETLKAPPADDRPGANQGDVARLRERLHHVIDLMSFDELAALPVRAAHLLHR